jgi:hypothetical protein
MRYLRRVVSDRALSGVDDLIKIFVHIASASLSQDHHNDARTPTLLAEPGCSHSFG